MSDEETTAQFEASSRVEEIRTALDAILVSRTFERSERLRRFLRYVCERALRGEAAELKEYLVGTDVFERGPGYSPHEDSIVRRQAHALRHKLLEYYATEGSNASIRIELPVGTYAPMFRRAKLAHEPSAEPNPIVSSTAPHAGRAAAAVVFGILLFLAGLYAGGHGLGLRHNGAVTQTFAPAILELWRPWFDDGSGAVICFSNPMTTVIKHFQKEVPPEPQSRRFRAAPTVDRLLRISLNLPSTGYLYLAPKETHGKMGEAIGAVYLASLLSRAGLPVRTTESRLLTWEDLRSQNLILLGHNDANQWLDPLLRKYPLRMEPSDGENPRRIRNVEPAKGEPSEYRYTSGGNSAGDCQQYALVSMIPGVDPRRNLLLISGLTPHSTLMAAEFLTNSSSLSELTTRLRASDPRHKGRWHFQAVLKVELHNKIPIRASVLSLRFL